MKIGVFDSGLGGLNVLNTISKSNKHEYFYLGDSNRAPYGDRSKDEIDNFSKEIVEFLLKFNIDHFIVACNTISATSLDFLREKFNSNFISIVDMGVSKALETDGDIVVLATSRACDSHIYKNMIEKNSNRKVYEIKARKLVPIIENGLTDKEALNVALDEYLDFANKNKVANILLGCTHYPIIKNQIIEKLNYNANIIDPSEYLKEHLNLKESFETKLNLFMTSKTIQTEKIAIQIFGKKVDIEQVSLK